MCRRAPRQRATAARASPAGASRPQTVRTWSVRFPSQRCSDAGPTSQATSGVLPIDPRRLPFVAAALVETATRRSRVAEPKPLRINLLNGLLDAFAFTAPSRRTAGGTFSCPTLAWSASRSVIPRALTSSSQSARPTDGHPRPQPRPLRPLQPARRAGEQVGHGAIAPHREPTQASRSALTLKRSSRRVRRLSDCPERPVVDGGFGRLSQQ
jgi:hypothetical protein